MASESAHVFMPRPAPPPTDRILSVRDLKTYFFADEGTTMAVDGATFDLYAGRTLGVVGETGCGKSVTARSILRIIEKPGRIVGGSIVLRRPAGGEVGRREGGRDPEIRLEPPAELGLRVPHDDAHGRCLAADLERRLEVVHVARRGEHGRPAVGEAGRLAGRTGAEVAAHDPGSGGHGPLQPFSGRPLVGDHGHAAAATAQRLHDLQAESPQSADHDGLHGGGL